MIILLFVSVFRAKPIDAFCEDYVCVIRGLIDVYETCFDPVFLHWANVMQKKQDELFWDNKTGGYFSSQAHDSSLLLRLKEGKKLVSEC